MFSRLSPLQDFIRCVPKVELHLHLIGSASLAKVAGLAQRSPGTLVPTDEVELEKYLQFEDFQHFIQVYGAVNALVTSGAAIADLVEGSAIDLAAQNVRYVEMTVTPYSHLMAGIVYEEVVEGLSEGRRRAQLLGVTFAWVYDIPGEMGVEAGEVTVRLATEQPPDGLVALGLGGVERGVSRGDFAELFARARASGLRSVPHAGEADGPASVWAAIKQLRADRIGHGVRAVEDPALLRYLSEHRLPLEVCPSSNVCTKVYPSMDAHPIKILIDAGVVVTLNSDDPPMFSTTLTDEYLRVARAFSLSLGEVAQLARNGVTSSFLDLAHQRALLDEIDATYTAALP